MMLLLSVVYWRVDTSGGQLNLSWQDDSADQPGFSVERSDGTSGLFTEIATTPSGLTSYTSQAGKAPDATAPPAARSS